MELPEDDPEVFGLLVDWADTEELMCKYCRLGAGGVASDTPPESFTPAHELTMVKAVDPLRQVESDRAC
jgi:hypothetical protein